MTAMLKIVTKRRRKEISLFIFFGTKKVVLVLPHLGHTGGKINHMERSYLGASRLRVKNCGVAFHTRDQAFFNQNYVCNVIIVEETTNRSLALCAHDLIYFKPDLQTVISYSLNHYWTCYISNETKV